MANTVNQVLTGFDASLMIDNVIVGRSEEFSVEIKQGLEAIYEQGTRKAVEIKEKKFEVSGSVKRFYINQDLVKKTIGGSSYANVVPYFTIQGYFKNESDGTVKTITIENAKFDSWKISAGKEENISEEMAYKALNVIFG